MAHLICNPPVILGLSPRPCPLFLLALYAEVTQDHLQFIKDNLFLLTPLYLSLLILIMSFNIKLSYLIFPQMYFTSIITTSNPLTYFHRPIFLSFNISHRQNILIHVCLFLLTCQLYEGMICFHFSLALCRRSLQEVFTICSC